MVSACVIWCGNHFLGWEEVFWITFIMPKHQVRQKAREKIESTQQHVTNFFSSLAFMWVWWFLSEVREWKGQKKWEASKLLNSNNEGGRRKENHNGWTQTCNREEEGSNNLKKNVRNLARIPRVHECKKVKKKKKWERFIRGIKFLKGSHMEIHICQGSHVKKFLNKWMNKNYIRLY